MSPRISPIASALQLAVALRFRVEVKGVAFRVQDSGFRVLGYRIVQGSLLRVSVAVAHPDSIHKVTHSTP